MAASDHLSPMQFFHGTSAHFEPGDFLTPQGANAYGRAEETSGRGFVYFTADKDQARNYAQARAENDYQGTGPHVYQVEPMGKYSEDPNDLYDSGRTRARLRVIREVND